MSSTPAVVAPAYGPAPGWRALSAALVAASLLACGCMDPLVADVYEPSSETLILPADAEVPWLDDAPDQAARMYAADGVEDFIPLRTAFADGEPVQYWDFGPAPAVAVPVWMLVRMDDDGEGFSGVPGHPTLFDAIPGDPGYSPFWQLYIVPVTAAYAGERITSLAAIDEGVQRGLLEEPVALPVYVNCPVVPRDALLDEGPDRAPREPNTAYVRGLRVGYFDLTPHLTPAEPFDGYPVAELYALRREGGEPLSEPERGVDMTGDGDLADSNDIFERGTADGARYTPLVRRVEVVVGADYRSIDSFADEAQADYRAASDLFETPEGGERRPIAGRVVALQASDQLYNLPIREVPEDDE